MSLLSKNRVLVNNYRKIFAKELIKIGFDLRDLDEILSCKSSSDYVNNRRSYYCRHKDVMVDEIIEPKAFCESCLNKAINWSKR